MESTLDMIESGMIPAGPCSPVRAKSGAVPASTLSSLSHWHGLLRRSQSTPHTKTESTPSSKGRSGSDEEMAVSDVTDLPCARLVHERSHQHVSLASLKKRASCR